MGEIVFVCIWNLLWVLVSPLIGFLRRAKGNAALAEDIDQYDQMQLLKAWSKSMSPSGKQYKTTISCSLRHRCEFPLMSSSAIVSCLHNDITSLYLNGRIKALTYSVRANSLKLPQRQGDYTTGALQGDRCHQRFSYQSQHKGRRLAGTREEIWRDKTCTET